MATHQTVGAFYRGWRLRGRDGTTLDLPDTPEDARPFGRPTTVRAEGASPPVRLLTLCELGTHAACGLSLKPIGHGEPSRVGPRLDHLGPGMLLIWDRGSFSYEPIRSVCQRGTHLRAWAKSNTVLRPSLACPTARTWPRSLPASPTAAATCASAGSGRRVHPRRPAPPRGGRATPADHRPDQPAGPAGA